LSDEFPLIVRFATRVYRRSPAHARKWKQGPRQGAKRVGSLAGRQYES
jgi:hypothetical protein